jgi:hypothetical protein
MDAIICDRRPGVSDSGKSTLGDCCQKHNPMTAPVVYPYRVTRGPGDNLRAEYRCACGNDWSCWWSFRCSGWTEEDIEALNQATAREDTGKPEGDWFHRGPCHACAACTGNGCYVWNDSLSPEIHICANGCDGLPPGLERAA